MTNHQGQISIPVTAARGPVFVSAVHNHWLLNSYVQAPVTEKVWITLGPEFSKDAQNTAC